MIIYSAYFSEEGLHRKVFTNGKVLFKFLETADSHVLRIEYGIMVGEDFELKEVGFTYANLLKVIKTQKENNMYITFTVVYGNAQIDIKGLEIVCK